MKALAEAGYVDTKRAGGRRGGTAWFRITKDGKQVFDRHVEALRNLTDEVPVSTDSPG